jgi:hypothetical protein
MVEIYLERAVQLSSARNLIQNDPPYAAATALLSVHTAIALNDALLLKLGAKSLKNEDHMASVRETVKRCKANGIDVAGVSQLKKLISAKSQVSYGDQSVSFDFASALSVASQRFEAWVYRHFQELA